MEDNNNGQNNFNDFNGNQNIELNVDNNNQQSIDEQDYNNNAMQNDLLQSDQPQGQKQKGKITDFIRKSSNPSVALMTVGLKIASLFFFLFLNIFTSNEAFVMIVVIIFDAMDFWYTKNISGRILVGLRWWNTYNPETQQEIWTFESKNEKKESTIDRGTFWLSLYGFTGAWLVLFIWECVIFNFMWACLCFISLAISGINTYGFFRCSKIQQKNMINIIKNYMNKKKNNN